MGTMNWEVGEVVYLKSGSARMTITAIDDATHEVELMWSSYQTNEVHKTKVPMAAITNMKVTRGTRYSADYNEEEDF